MPQKLDSATAAPRECRCSIRFCSSSCMIRVGFSGLLLVPAAALFLASRTSVVRVRIMAKRRPLAMGGTSLELLVERRFENCVGYFHYRTSPP